MVCGNSDHGAHEVVLWMESCDPRRLVPNTVMLCTRSAFLLEHMQDIYPKAYNEIIRSSGCAGMVSMTTNGTRIYPNEKGLLAFKPGDYGKDEKGDWYARTPTGLTGCLKNHEVIEHEDGTITVSPSILVDDGNKNWHGYLEKGVWREV